MKDLWVIARWLAVAVLGSGMAMAQNTLLVGIDSDNDVATGCDITVNDAVIANQTVSGYDSLFRIEVESGTANPSVTGLVRQDCSGGAFSVVSSDDSPGFSLSFNSGPSGSDAVEGLLPATIASPFVRLVFFSKAANDSEDVVAEGGAGQATEAALVSTSPAQIPTLSEWGLILLAAAIAGAAFALLRRRPAGLAVLLLGVCVTGTVGVEAFVDSAAKALFSDPIHDTTGGNPVSDIVQAQAIADADGIWVSIHVVDLQNAPPQIDLNGPAAGSGYNANFNEGDGFIDILDSLQLSVTDDGGTLSSASVTITNPQDGADEALRADPGATGIAVAYDSSSGVLSLTGLQSAPQYRTVLRSVQYENRSMNPGTVARAVSFVVNDGALDSPTVISNVTINGVNDAPAIDLNGPAAGSGFAAAFTEGDPPLSIVDSAQMTTEDLDSPNLASASVTIANLQDGGAELLAADTGGTSIAAAFVGGVLSLTGIDSVANYQQVLRSVTYQNTSQAPSSAARSIEFVANDGMLDGNVATSTVTVTPVNDPPTISDIPNQITDEDMAAGPIAFTVDDVDSDVLTLAVSASSSNQALIADADITLGGAGANRTIVLVPSMDATGTATITVTVDDGSDTSMDLFDVQVGVVNDPPTVSAVSDQTIGEDSSTGPLALTVGDVDNDPATLVVTAVSSNQSLIPNGNIAFAGSGTNRTIAITPAADESGGTSTVTVTVDDGNDSVMTTFDVTVDPVNDAPSYTNSGGNPMILEDSGPSSLPNWATAISAGPANESGQMVTFNIVNNDMPGLFSTGPAVSSGGTLSFTPAPNANGTATITVRLMDDGGTANGGVNVSPDEDFTITITPVDDPPALFGHGSLTWTEGDPAAAISPALTVFDREGDQINSGQVVITNFVPGEDVLDCTPSGAVTCAFSAGTLTLSGMDGPAVYQTVLRSVTYINTGGDAPTAGIRDLTCQLTSDVAPMPLSNLLPANVEVVAVNDDPMAENDVYATIGNTELAAGGASPASLARVVDADGVLAKGAPDSDPEAMTLSVVDLDGDASEPFVSTSGGSGGTMTMSSDGSFTYVPPAGLKNFSETFTYTIDDGATGQDTATVTVNVADALIWYVHNDPTGEPLNPAGGDGRSNDPFDLLNDNVDDVPDNDAQEASGNGDRILVFEGDGATTGQDLGISLKNGQKLIGHASASLMVAGVTITLPAPGARPKITNDSPAAVVDATTADRTGVEIRNLDLAGGGGMGTDSNAVDVTSAGANDVSVTIDNCLISDAADEGIDLNPDGNGSFDITLSNNVFSTSSPDGNAIDLTTAASSGNAVTLSIDGNADITSGSGNGIHIDGMAGTGSQSVTVTGFNGNAVHGNTAGTGIFVRNATFETAPGGAFEQVAAGNTTIGSMANPVGGKGMDLDNVSGDLRFSTLVIDSTGTGLEVAGSGFFAAGPPSGSGFQLGTDPSASRVNAAAGAAVDLDPFTAALRFDSLSSANSPNRGVRINNVGGLVTVNGTTDIDSPAGNGIEIANSPGAFTFASIDIDDAGANGIDLDGNSGTFEVTGATMVANTMGTTGIEVTNSAASFTADFGVTTVDDTAVGAGANANGIDLQSSNDIASMFTFASLSVTTDGGFGLRADNSGIVSLENAASTINASGGPAIDIASTGLRRGMSNGVTFASLTSAGSPGNGIRLSALGSSDNVTVTGAATISNPSDNGIEISLTGGAFTADFASISVEGAGNDGISFEGNTTGNLTVGGGSIGAADDPGANGVDIDQGNGTVAISASITKTTSGEAVEITQRSGGSVTISGSIACSSGCTGLNVANNTGGSSTFSGSTKTVNTGTNAAVTLTANTGHAINFTGGGLDVDTTSADGFTATGGGAINVTGGSNTVTTQETSAGADNAGSAVVMNGVTIGADDMTFASLSATNTAAGTEGLDFDAVSNAGQFIVTGAATVNDTGGSAPGIDVRACSASFSFATVTIDETGGAGINLFNNTGEITVSGGSIGAGNDPAGNGVDIDQAQGNVTIAASIANATARAVEVTNSGGNPAITIALTGAIDEDGAGILLSNNDQSSGATVSFSGGMTLDTGANTAFSATAGGTVNVSGTNTIGSSATPITGIGVNIADTTIGAGGVAFQSVHVNGASSGIVLSNTGSAGTFSVTGTGAADSGGTISGTMDGVSLNVASGVTLTEMAILSSSDNGVDATGVNGLVLDSLRLDGAGSHGIRGVSLTNFTLSNSSVVRNAGNTNEEHGIQLRDLFGNSLIEATTIELMEEDGIELINDDVDDGLIDVLTIRDSFIQDNNAAGFGENGITVRAQDNGNLRLIVENTIIRRCDGDGINAASDGNDNNGFLDLRVIGTTISDNDSRGIVAGTANNQDMDVRILDGTTVFGNRTTPIAITGNQSGTLNVTIDNTTGMPADNISVTGSQNVSGGIGARCLEITADDNAAMAVSIADLTAQECDFAALWALARNTARMDLTVRDSSFAATGAFLEESVTIVAGTNTPGDAGRVCLNMLDNTAHTSGGVLDDYRLRARLATNTFELQDFVGNGSVAGDVQNWVNVVKSNIGSADVGVVPRYSAAAQPCALPPP